jgi:hypothetical protein
MKPSSIHHAELPEIAALRNTLALAHQRNAGDATGDDEVAATALQLEAAIELAKKTVHDVQRSAEPGDSLHCDELLLEAAQVLRALELGSASGVYGQASAAEDEEGVGGKPKGLKNKARNSVLETRSSLNESLSAVAAADPKAGIVGQASATLHPSRLSASQDEDGVRRGEPRR